MMLIGVFEAVYQVAQPVVIVGDGAGPGVGRRSGEGPTPRAMTVGAEGITPMVGSCAPGRSLLQAANEQRRTSQVRRTKEVLFDADDAIDTPGRVWHAADSPWPLRRRSQLAP